MTLPDADGKTGRAQFSTEAAQLLAWYDVHHRELAWRTGPADRKGGVRPDPYRVWLSEIMLQQTTVEAVKPYFRSFLERWPDMKALAAADIDDVMKAWAGLGYYSRARNLAKCAKTVVQEFGGDLPSDIGQLRKLPGIGDYTAAAIAAIAFDIPAVVVDGNVERVVARYCAIGEAMPAAKKTVKTVAGQMTPPDRPGDFAQAMMDLGALICTPKRPDCIRCPINHGCAGLKAGNPEIFPVKAAKQEKPLRRAAAFVAVRGDGAILLRKRPEKGLLGGMAEVPTSGFTARKDGEISASGAPFSGSWKKTGIASHVFTHFRLELITYRCDDGEKPVPDGYWWAAPHEIAEEALPTVMLKAIAAAGIDPGLRANKTSHRKPDS